MSRFVLTAQLQLQAPNNVAQVVRQIQSQLNNVSVNVQVQGAAQAQRQIQQISNQTNQAATAAERMGRAFAVSVRRFAAFSIATRAVGLFTSTLSDAVQTAIDFERQMIKVSQVTGDSLAKLRGLTKTITSLSTGLGVSSQSLLDVSTVLLQAGLNAKDTEVALKSLAKAALAPNFDSISETAEGAIAILAQFQEGVGALEKQLGSINAVAGAFAVEAGDLIDVIRRTGGVFKSSGGSLNELLALFTSVRATTRESAESIGTGLRTIFTRIQRPKTIEFLKQFGVELVDLEGKFVGPFEAVKRLSSALAGLGEGDLTFIRIAEELGGFRQIGKVLPLLQQFSTAQAALNVAQNAGNSLTKDAETAQAALAIRIIKVKEEFLALVRSITETSTFQVMANTALSLASALIKLADSIKPLLPLLGALAAVKIAKGLSSFAGGILGGLGSSRTFNQGGRVHKFARGGLVPGTGNRDTVPAMLSPGEFVIRKSSVNKLGAGTLAAMNENRYAIGGMVGGIGLTPSDQTSTGSGKVSVSDIIKALISNSNLPGGISGNKKIFEGVKSRQSAQQVIANIGGFSGTSPSSSRTFTAKGQSFKDADLNRQIGDDVELGMKNLISNAASVLGSSIGVGITGSPNSALIKSIGSADVLGKIFEGALNLLGAPFDPLAAKQDRDSFDFPSGLGGALGSYFKGFENIPVDAKKNITPDILNDIATRKTKNLIAGQVNTSAQFQALKKTKQFASGGGVGTDTVPALLTPGEFVVNRKSAQSIGYGNLNRMNKVGKYAKGGVVQNFATGTAGTGAKPIISNTSADQIGAKAFGINPKLFSILDKTVFSLADVFRGVGRESQKTLAAFSAISAISPQLVDSIRSNSIANNRTKTTQEQVALRYADRILALQNQGKSDAQIQAAMSKYVVALDKDTQAKLASASSTRMPTGARPSPITVNPPPVPPAMGQNPFATMGGTMGSKAGGSGNISGNTQAVNANTKAQQGAAKSAMEVVNNNKMFAASMATSLISGFLPAIDENSGAMLRMTHSLLGLITTITSVGFALEAFGVNLNAKNITSLLSGGVSGLANRAGGAAGSAVLGMGGGANLAVAASAVTTALTKIVAPIAATSATFMLLQSTGNSLVESFMNYEGRLKKAIEGGNVEQARSIATEQQRSKSAVNVVAGSISGAVLGSFLTPILGPLGPMLGSQVGAIIGGALSDLPEYAGQVAASQAAFVSSQKALSKASEDATKALSDFEKGSISVTQLLQSTSSATAAVAQSRQESNKLIAAGDKNRDSGLVGGLRNVFTLGGLLGETTGQKDARINSEQEKSRKEVNKQEEEAIRVAQPAMNALSKQIAMTGGSFDDLMSKIRETDPNLYQILIRQGTNDLNKSFQNVAKEAARTKAALEAANLGLRSAQATSTAMSSSMDRFAAGLEVGGNTFVANTEFLSKAMTSAAQAMDPSDIKAAVGDVSKNLSAMGVSSQFVNKFEGNTNAFIQAQQNYGKAFDNIIAESKSMGKVFSADELKDKFANELGDLMGPDVSDEAKANLKSIIGGIELNPDEINQIMSGNYQAFGDKLTEAGQKQFEEIMKIAQERQKAEQVLINLTKTRIDAERNFVDAQKQAIDLAMEGREVQGKYGGRAVTNEERRASIVAKANAGASRLGLSEMGQGGIADLRRRRQEIVTGSASIEGRRRVDGGMQGVDGETANETQRDLDNALKDQIQTVRDLIKLEEDELRIIQEKNKLEKQSLESLISGDIDKFFEQQASVGAQAALATGDQRLINQFSGDAIGGAFSDLQRQAEAGVQSLYGQNLQGPGGLLERAGSSALASRGVQNPMAAQVLAGTTAAEEASKARLRELGGELTALGQAGADMAEMKVQTATINVTSANFKLQEITERGRAAAEAAQMNRGGIVYANRGIFVPRGTDTVPAMLTPGEFVVNRAAVNRGNNLQILQAMNRGESQSSISTGTQTLARGGTVRNGTQYLAFGGLTQAISNLTGGDFINNLTQSFSSFLSGMTESIQKLQNTKFQISLDTTNVNVNLMGGSFLSSMKEELKKELLSDISNKMNQMSVGNGGKLTDNRSTLPKPG